MQTDYSVKQPSKCDHATQMQLEVIKICSSESKSHPKSQAVQLRAVKMLPGTLSGWHLQTRTEGSEMIEQSLCYTGKPSAERWRKEFEPQKKNPKNATKQS